MITTGVSYRKLDVPSIDRLIGADVYYSAAMTQAFTYRDEDVYLVGGANSAGQAAMYFSRYARNVTMLVRSDSLAKMMSQYLVDQITNTKNIRVWLHSSVVEVKGDNNLKGVKLTVPTGGLFIFIGAQPRTDWLSQVVATDVNGFILTGPDLAIMTQDEHKSNRLKGWSLNREPFLLETNLPGLFAAGDVRYGSLKRVASGVGEGSIVVQFVHQYGSVTLIRLLCMYW